MQHSQYQTWQPSAPISLNEPWQGPDKPVYFITDMHADADAFLNSLKLGSLVTEDSSLQQLTMTANAHNATIMIGGDIFDKGPSHLELLNLLTELKQKHSDLVILAGNHDLRIYAGLIALDHMNDLRQCHFFARMGRKTTAFFAEIYQHYCDPAEALSTPESWIENQLMPDEDWFELFPQYACHFMTDKQIKKELKQLRKKRIDFFQSWQEMGYNPNQLLSAVNKAKEIMLAPDGQYRWLFDELELIQQRGSFLYCHAGVDDIIAQRLQHESIAALNHEFKQLLKQGRIFQFYYSELGNIVRTKYRKKDSELSPFGAQVLHNLGIHSIVNGHRGHTNGQQMILRQQLITFECDTELNCNCRKKFGLPQSGASVTIFTTQAMVIALCSELEQPKLFNPELYYTEIPNLKFA